MSDSQPALTVTGRLRKASLTAADALLNFNPQPGIWAATGTAIAYAPTLTELREPVAGGENIEFNAQGHSARTVVRDEEGDVVLGSVLTRTGTRGAMFGGTNTRTVKEGKKADQAEAQIGLEKGREVEKPTLAAQAQQETDEKHNWAETTKHAFSAVWKFANTPTGFFITLYGLNVVAWGAMLFFLLLGAAPAMNHPSKNYINSPRKKWIEIDSQILNALFCVTGFGLAPWRVRDLYWFVKARGGNGYAMGRLVEQNKSWYRPPGWWEEGRERDGGEGSEARVTFTGRKAPETGVWKLGFVVFMMVMNTLFQGALAGFMWGFNRVDRPNWSTGAFIGLGCGVSLAAGVMMWWEGRKVKKIEGPVVKVVDISDVEKEVE